MVFTKRLRDGVRHGRITCSVRIWTKPHVKTGGRYPMDDGHIVVDAIESIRLKDITSELARVSGFTSVKDLLETAKHGAGRNVYLVRFHYLPPGGWDVRRPSGESRHEGRAVLAPQPSSGSRSQLLHRIRSTAPVSNGPISTSGAASSEQSSAPGKAPGKAPGRTPASSPARSAPRKRASLKRTAGDRVPVSNASSGASSSAPAKTASPSRAAVSPSSTPKTGRAPRAGRTHGK